MADDRADWKAQIDDARARATEARQKAMLELQRRRAEPQAAEPWEVEVGRRNSEAVINDSSLRYGDVISTTAGQFRFIGRGDTEPKPSDFVPLGRDGRGPPVR